MLNPYRYRIFAVGKVRKKWIKDGISLYLKRLPGLKIKEFRDSNSKKEGEEILFALKKNEKLVTLTEEGESLASIPFAEKLRELGSQQLVFAIGGADGLAPETKESADWSLSLSPLTFPHEIARLLLIEQLYRAHAITSGLPYHRGKKYLQNTQTGSPPRP